MPGSSGAAPAAPPVSSPSVPPPGPVSSRSAPQRGVSLGLFSEDAGFSYRPLLAEIAALGADHVELVVAWYLDDVEATEVRDHRESALPAPPMPAGGAVLTIPTPTSYDTDSRL